MNVEVLNTGSELLLGSVINVHVATFAHALFPLGLRIARQVSVPDGEPIRAALAEALGRAEIILVTGGLGPTTDDITRDITADLLDRPLSVDPTVLETIRARFAARGAEMTPRVARQAEVPHGARVLPNAHGTAPGLYLEIPAESVGGHPVHLFLLPGPPRELGPMIEESLIPILRGLLPQRTVQECHVYHIIGIGESNVEALVGEKLLALPGLELGYCARPGEVDVRCIGSAATLAKARAILTETLGDRIVSEDGRNLEGVLVETLTTRGETLATAESCTGGLLANRITNIPGASAVLLGGYVCYSNEAKSTDLGVNPLKLEAHGAVSSEVATEMAEGALRRSGADWALATTGIAGPGGGTDAKPVGTVYVALAHRSGPTHVEPHRFRNRDREGFKLLATNAALDLLRRALGWQRG